MGSSILKTVSSSSFTAVSPPPTKPAPIFLHRRLRPFSFPTPLELAANGRTVVHNGTVAKGDNISHSLDGNGSLQSCCVCAELFLSEVTTDYDYCFSENGLVAHRDGKTIGNHGHVKPDLLRRERIA